MKSIVSQEYSTITEMLNCSSAGRDERLLFVEEKKNGQHITFRRWRQDLLETAARFMQMDAKHIAVICDISYDSILCMYAAIMAGKVLVPLAADLSEDMIDWYVEKADAELLIYGDKMIDSSLIRCKSMLTRDFLNIPAEALSEWPQWEGDRNAAICFTSGTEGEPLGVVLTQKNLSFTIYYKCRRKTAPVSRILIFLPIHHVFSFVTISNCINYGCEIHLSANIKYVQEELQRVKPEMLTTVPMVNELFRKGLTQGIAASGKKKQLDNLIHLSNTLRKVGIDLRTPLFRGLRDQLGLPQLLVSGGAAASEDTIRFFDDFGIIVLQAYGSTETTALVTSNLAENNKPGSVGPPFCFTKIRIKDSEIQVHSDNVMKEYYKNPQASQAAFDDGWFKTGDLGYIDQDGYLYISGRKKNLIILDSGENVSPEELEKLLLQSPLIEEALVCERDGHIHAQIVAAARREEDEPCLKSAIQSTIDKLNRHNPLYKRIVSWELIKDSLEKTTSLKVRR